MHLCIFIISSTFLVASYKNSCSHSQFEICSSILKSNNQVFSCNILIYIHTKTNLSMSNFSVDKIQSQQPTWSLLGTHYGSVYPKLVPFSSFPVRVFFFKKEDVVGKKL